MTLRKSVRSAVAPLAALALVGVAACSGGGDDAGDRTPLEMWFWGAPAAHQEAMQQNLVDAFNDSQEDYELSVTFDPSVDANIQTALAADGGPDIVYGSGPAFVAPYAAEGKLVNMDEYAQEYGWKDRILAPMYESGTVDGSLYALPNSVNTLGIFYNQAVLDQYGWSVPTTIDELVEIMDEAQAEGLYSSVTGNSGWQPVNENYASLFMTAVAGPDKIEAALTGEGSWTDPAILEAVETSRDWYQAGYLGGDDYTSLNFTQSMQMLADGESPFFIGPTLAFQFATDYFNDDAGNTDDLGFTSFPTIGDGLASPLYTLGTTASFSINAASDAPDGAAEVIDFMMSHDFMETMTAEWPGYWGVPLSGVQLDPSEFTGLSADYVTALNDMFAQVDAGSFGYFTATFFPPVTQQDWINIDTVWNDVEDPQAYLENMQSDFDEELAAGDVPPIPAQG